MTCRRPDYAWCVAESPLARHGSSPAELQERIGYRFRNIHHLHIALTHASANFGKPGAPDYERLEFLGDRVLGLAQLGFQRVRVGTIDVWWRQRVVLASMAPRVANTPRPPAAPQISTLCPACISTWSISIR